MRRGPRSRGRYEEQSKEKNGAGRQPRRDANAQQFTRCREASCLSTRTTAVTLNNPTEKKVAPGSAGSVKSGANRSASGWARPVHRATQASGRCRQSLRTPAAPTITRCGTGTADCRPASWVRGSLRMPVALRLLLRSRKLPLRASDRSCCPTLRINRSRRSGLPTRQHSKVEAPARSCQSCRHQGAHRRSAPQSARMARWMRTCSPSDRASRRRPHR